MTQKKLPLPFLLCLLAGTPLLAQRPDAGAGKPGSAPSVRPAPAPSVRPAPAPVSRPQPAPASRPQPAPVSRPQPAARPQPAPVSRPQPVTSRPQPATNTPGGSPRGNTRGLQPAQPQPTPSTSRPSNRPTTRATYDAAPRPQVGTTPAPSTSPPVPTWAGSRTTNTPPPRPAGRGQPAPSDATTQPTSAAPRAIGGAVRGSSARDIYDRGSRGDSNAPRGKSLLGDRYQPTPTSNQPSNPTRTPTNRSDASSRDAGRSKPAPAPADTIRTGSVRGDSRAAANQRPADVVRSRTEPAHPGRGANGIAAAGAPRSMTSSAIVRQTTAPRLNPSSVTNRMVARSQRSAYGGHVRVYDPYCYAQPYSHAWGYQSPFHWHCGSGHFAWSFSLWHPWFVARTGLWHDCHRDWWWQRSTCYSRPSNLYWWYPSSVYCPTYLYVPSTVIYRETTYVDSAPAAAIQPADAGGGTELAPRTLADKYLELGDFYFRAGRYTEAADAYARARTYAPNDAGVHLVLADAAFADGDHHFAAYLIGEALRLDPSLATVKFDKRTLYGTAADFEAQMNNLDRYLADKPYDAMAHLVRGYNLLFSDRPLTALAAFRRVLEIDPSNATASRFLAALETPEGASEESLR